MRKLIIIVPVLLGLLVAADYGAAAAGEYQVAKQLNDELELTTEPSVRIGGFPFIYHALSGHYPQIDMQASGLRVGSLSNLAIEATLYDVDAPVSEVTNGNLESVRADLVDGRVRIKDTDLGRAIGLNDLRLEPVADDELDEIVGSRDVDESDEDSSTAVRMITHTDIAGERTQVIGVGLIELVDGTVQVSAVDIRLATDDAGETDVPEFIRRQVREAFSTTINPGGLPFAVTPTAVYVETGSVVVEGEAHNVRFNEAGVGIG